MMSYLAYASNTSFVFEDYTWSHAPFPYTVYDFALRPTHIPLNAFISGPAAGGPVSAPKAVSAEFYEHACSDRNLVYTISSEHAPNDADGIVMIDWWVRQLAVPTTPCIEIDSAPHVVFDRL